MELDVGSGGVHAEHGHLREPDQQLHHLLRIGLEISWELAGPRHRRTMAA
jgi:hypothetical protein